MIRPLGPIIAVFQAGFLLISFARKLGIPRIYLSANSGARIGMADELIPFFSVAWNNPGKPEAGFKYLYLTPEVKKRFDASKQKEVITEQITDEGEERHKITTVIGAKDAEVERFHRPCIHHPGLSIVSLVSSVPGSSC
ncbi:unnamed protein product [Penicillium bialowiezense]